MIGAWPIFAVGLDDIVPVLIVIVIMVVSAVAQLMGKVRQAGPPQGPRGAQPQGGKLMDEIGEFLRRATEAAQQEQQPPQREPRQERPKPAIRPKEQPIRAEAVETAARGSESLGAAIASADDAIDSRLHKVFDHELSTLGGSKGASASTAGQDLSAEGCVMTQADDTSEGIDVSAIVLLLSNPQGVRDAVLLSEILTRPEHRWN